MSDTVYPLEDLYIRNDIPDLQNAKYGFVSMIQDSLAGGIDHFEWHLGLQRGELSEKHPPYPMKVVVRPDIAEAYFDGQWALIPSDSTLLIILGELRRCLDSNLSSPERKQIFLSLFKPDDDGYYTYRLFFWPGQTGVMDSVTGSPCFPGETLVSAAAHPLLALMTAYRFFFMRQDRFTHATATVFHKGPPEKWGHFLTAHYRLRSIFDIIKRPPPNPFFQQAPDLKRNVPNQWLGYYTTYYDGDDYEYKSPWPTFQLTEKMGNVSLD